MKTTLNNYTQKGFKYSIYGLTLIMLIVLLSVLLQVTNIEIFSLLIGALVFIIGVVSLMGLIYSLKGIRSKNNLKKLMAIIVNTSLVVLFVYALIANVMDIYKALY